jgi:hypothetical protein
LSSRKYPPLYPLKIIKNTMIKTVMTQGLLNLSGELVGQVLNCQKLKMFQNMLIKLWMTRKNSRLTCLLPLTKLNSHSTIKRNLRQLMRKKRKFPKSQLKLQHLL